MHGRSPTKSLAICSRVYVPTMKMLLQAEQYAGRDVIHSRRVERQPLNTTDGLAALVLLVQVGKEMPSLEAIVCELCEAINKHLRQMILQPCFHLSFLLAIKIQR